MEQEDQISNESARMADETDGTLQGGNINNDQEDFMGTWAFLRQLSLAREVIADEQVETDIVLRECQFLKREKLAKIQAWVNNVPNNCASPDSDMTRDVDAKVLQEWIHWRRVSALGYIHNLDRYERRYRRAAFDYHRILHIFRQSSAPLQGAKIDQRTIIRLKQILEVNRSRKKQSFFHEWLEIYDTVMKIIKEIDANQPPSNDPAVLREALNRYNNRLHGLERPRIHIKIGLEWLEGAVARVVARAPGFVTTQIELPHSREGMLFRQLIQTFPEIDNGLVKSSDYTEFYVQHLLEVGVRKEPYWTMLMPLDEGKEERVQKETTSA